MRSIRAEIPRFLVFGGLTTAASYAIYLVLLLFMRYELAYSLSFAAGIVLSYTLNTLFVFHQPWSWKKLAQFPLVYAVHYLAGLALLSLLVGTLRVDERIAPLVNVVLLVPLTFALARWVVRRE